VDLADHVVVRLIWRAAGLRPEAKIEFTIIYTLRKRRIFLMEYFWDHAETLEAVGPSGQTMPEGASRSYRTSTRK
jgi:hypothetical protein